MDSSLGLAVKVLGLSPAISHMSQLWRQEQQTANIAPLHQKSAILHVNTCKPS